MHRGTSELSDGRLRESFECPERLDKILSRLSAAGFDELIAPDAGGLDILREIHSEDYLNFLETAWALWTAQGRDCDALPFVWPARGMRQYRPEHIDGQLAYYAFDVGTPITAGTWQAATTAARVAISGAKRLSAGEPAAFALCRPPGHHAARNLFGGYCFLNNAAAAAQQLINNGATRVAILDVDYHHGNGTQSIFYERSDVFFVSIHAAPEMDFPYFTGFADERGAGDGEQFNLNFPLPWETNFEKWFKALDEACQAVQGYEPDALVVSLGVDTYEGDPISNFLLQNDDYLKVGRRIAQLGTPTLFVMEGGYAVDDIGINVVNVLTGFSDA